jgi:MFS transporter, DHA2 family, glioxin efflux transporter
VVVSGPIFAETSPTVHRQLTQSTHSFYINLPIGGFAAACVAVLFRTPESALPPRLPLVQKLKQFDVAGVFLIMGAVVCYLLAMQWGGQKRDWSSSSVIGTLIGFVLITAAFVGVEYKLGEKALLQPRLMRMRSVAVACPYVFL